MGLTPALLAALAFAIEVRVSVNPSSASTDTESEHVVWQQHGPFRTHLDTLLYGFREFELTVLLLSGGSAECRRTCDSSAAAWRSYLPHANISVVHGLPEFGLDLDVVVDCGGRPAEQQSQDLRVLFGADGRVGVKPGGMLVHELRRCSSGSVDEPMRERILDLIDTLHRGSFRSHDDLSKVPQEHINVQTVTVAADVVVLTRKGALDDQEYMTNGDYGTQYGEARHGMISRALHRQFRVPWEKRRKKYFLSALALLPVRIAKLSVEMRAPRRKFGVVRAHGKPGVSIAWQLRPDAEHWHGDDSETEGDRDSERATRQLSMPLAAAKTCLLRDFEFALSVHAERMQLSEQQLQLDGDDTLVLSVLPEQHPRVRGVLRHDYTLHSKKGVWRTWRTYFGPSSGLQPLSVVAQTIREKLLMVSRDDDQSDLYRGRCSRALIEGYAAGQVVVHTYNCSELEQVLLVHDMGCAKAAAAEITDDGAPPHSPLYYLHAKAKWDGYIGVPPVGDHERDDVADPPHVEMIAEPDGRVFLQLADAQGTEGAELAFNPVAEDYIRLRQAMRDVRRQGGVALLTDAQAGVLEFSPEQQRSVVERYWRHVRPGGLYAVDGLFHGQYARMQPGGAYALFRAIVAAKLDDTTAATVTRTTGVGEIDDVAYVMFNTNNLVMAKAGNILAPGREDERGEEREENYYDHDHDDDDDDDSNDNDQRQEEDSGDNDDD